MFACLLACLFVCLFFLFCFVFCFLFFVFCFLFFVFCFLFFVFCFLFFVFYTSMLNFSFQGQLLAEICNDMGWDRVATISTSNAYGVSIIEQFTNRASALSITFLSSQTFQPDASPNESLLQDAVALTKASGARVIIVAMIQEDAQNFLRVAYDQGLTSYATFVVTDGVAQDALFETDDSDLLREAASGMIGTSPVGASGPLYDAFLEDWINRDPVEYPGAGNSDVNTFVPHTYDATYAMAWALDRLVRRNVTPSNGSALLASVQQETNFPGLTGNVTFDENGDRFAIYQILNFYDSGDGAIFTEVGNTEGDDRIYTAPIIFRDGSTVPPDAAERVYVAYDDASGIAMVSLCAAGIVITLICTGRIMMGRNTPIIVYASPRFILLIMLGIVIGFCNVFVWTGEPTDSLCQARPWILVLNFVLIFGGLYAKAGRVYHLLHQRKTFAFKPIKDTVLFGYVFLYSLVFIIPLIVWTAAYPLEVDRSDDNPDNDKVNIKCSGENSAVFLGLFLGLAGLSLLLGVFISYLNRNFHDFFSEIQYVGYTLYTVTITCCVVLPMLFILEDEPDAFYIVLMLGIVFANFAALLFLFTPKLYILIFRPSENALPTDEGGHLQTKRQKTEQTFSST